MGLGLRQELPTVGSHLPCSQTPPEHEYVYAGEPVSFLYKHDIIKIGLKQKGNVLHVVQPTMRSMLGVYDIRCPRVTPNLHSFSCSDSWVHPPTMKVSLPPLYLWSFSRDKKYQALHACTTLVFAFQSVRA